MNSKDLILNNLPKKFVTDEDITLNFNTNINNIFEKFISSLHSNHSEYITIDHINEIKEIIPEYFPKIEKIVNTIEELNLTSIDLSSIQDPKELNNTDISIIKANFGIADTGAMWIDFSEIKFNIIPFICENLIIVLDKAEIVPDMISAYEKTDCEDYEYGVYIAGPSKTADIEQTLVTGAQGAKRLLVVLLN